MSNPSFATTILVDQTPEQALAAINNARGVTASPPAA